MNCQNKSRLGQLIQLSLLNEGENEDLVKGIFYMNVREFKIKPSAEANLIRKFLFRESPEWLKEHGNKIEQMHHLQERVLIHIFERFEFNKIEKFAGYKLTLD